MHLTQFFLLMSSKSYKNHWKKLGRIFVPDNHSNSMVTHASVPIAEHISDDIFKVYFSSRDINQRSFCNYILVDINNPKEILEISSNPVLSPGDLGSFDDSGAMASWLVNKNNINYLYYIGWNLGITVPFRNAIGLAQKNEDGNFQKISNAPIINLSDVDPFMSGSCCVIPCEDRWRMWYLSCTEWFRRQDDVIHKYHIKYAESSDGINWNREGIIAIDFKNDDEVAISRPSVIFDCGKWKMWFSYRGTSYKIGYAESNDGIHWERQDNLSGIDVSADGWDSESVEYPYVFKHKDLKYMFYNGNNFGKTGLGLAIWN